MKEDNPTYILITQCLQNGFFLDEESQLCLPEEEVIRMLIGSPDDMEEEIKTGNKKKRNNVRDIPQTLIKKGPLYQFLKTVIEDNERTEPLHVINIRDWHGASENYNEERRLYGTHCEADTWAAEPIEGFENLLTPWKGANANAQTVTGHVVPNKMSSCHFYDIRSDTLFDFKSFANNEKTLLEKILDKLIYNSQQVYILVIGVYTDIKIRILLSSLLTHYNIDNLVVSDVLTGAPSLGRHLEALDFISKVLRVEIIHSLNDLVTFLSPASSKSKQKIPKDLITNSIRYHDYSTYI